MDESYIHQCTRMEGSDESASRLPEIDITLLSGKEKQKNII